MSTLIGKVAVITGGSSGIGLAAAQAFIEHGAKVVIFGRSAIALAQATQALGDNSHAVQGDVTQQADLVRLFEQATSRFGGIDVLFINVAIGKLLPIEQTTEADYDAMMAVNLKGAYFTLQKSIPHLNRDASVILTTSWINRIGFAGTSLLSASKAALRSLARVASAELADRGIRVNAVSPGAIATPFWGKLGLSEAELNGAAAALTSQIPLKRFGQPEEVAKAVLFLASSDSSYVVGDELVVDGGRTQL